MTTQMFKSSNAQLSKPSIEVYGRDYIFFKNLGIMRPLDIQAKPVNRFFTAYDIGEEKNIKHSLAFFKGRAIVYSKLGIFQATDCIYTDKAEMLYYYDNHANVHFPQIVKKLAS